MMKKVGEYLPQLLKMKRHGFPLWKPITGEGEYVSQLVSGFVRKVTREKGRGYNYHRSNRAKEGLYHGKDVRSGNSISHSHTKTKRKFHPNVQKKRVWSDTLNDWVQFKMTTTAMKAIDDIGGIDQYLLSMDDNTVRASRQATKVREMIASKLFHKGLLHVKIVKKLGYHLNPPPLIQDADTKGEEEEDDDENSSSHSVKKKNEKTKKIANK